MILHQADWCRPRGFYLDPALIPPDDEAQDAVCAIRAAVVHARIDAGIVDIDADRDRTSAGADGEAPGPAMPAGRRPGARPHFPAAHPSAADAATTTPTVAASTPPTTESGLTP